MSDSHEAGMEATLGDVLYATPPRTLESEEDWIALVHAVAAQDAPALHALFERAHRPVFTLALRITGSVPDAEAVTLDVFLDVWRQAASHDPQRDAALGWIMNLARARSLAALRTDEEQQSAATTGGSQDPLERIKTNIRSGLQKLHGALGTETRPT